MSAEKVTDGQMYMEANIDHSPPFKENYELCYIMLSELHTECPLLPGNAITSCELLIANVCISIAGEAHYEYTTKIPNLMPPVR